MTMNLSLFCLFVFCLLFFIFGVPSFVNYLYISLWSVASSHLVRYSTILTIALLPSNNRTMDWGQNELVDEIDRQRLGQKHTTLQAGQIDRCQEVKQTLTFWIKLHVVSSTCAGKNNRVVIVTVLDFLTASHWNSKVHSMLWWASQIQMCSIPARFGLLVLL